MLGRTIISPWFFTAALAAVPVLAQAAEDPFAEVEPETPAAAPESPEADGGDPFDENAADSEASADDSEGATSSLEDEYGFDPAGEFASEEEPADRDPWEGFNRAVFRFNDTADRWVLKPVAVSYRQITPIFVQTGVSNFFGNLREVTNTTNSILQWKWGQAGNDAGRFLINTTVGIAGLFDVAEHMGLEPSDGEDFGQTLATWGMPSGPYLVVPLFGPSTLRDGPARAVDYYTDPISYVDHTATRNSLYFTNMIQRRAGLLKAEMLLQGDRYVLLRDAYLQRREYLIKDGELEDDFGGDLDGYEF